MNSSQEVHYAAQQVAKAPGPSLVDALNAFIARFVGWPFPAAAGKIVDAAGNQTDTFACVVHTTPAITDGPHAGAFPADGAAAVIDASENLSLDALRAAYSRIAQAKRLKKKPVPS